MEHKLEQRFQELSQVLLDEMNEDGFWTGRLSSSALAVAVAVAALHFDSAERNKTEIHLGLNWLKNNINSDGSFGDTPESPGNISTSLLVYASLNLYSENNDACKSLQSRISDYLQKNNIDIESDNVADVILGHYQKDYTFSVPILTMCALCGIPKKDAFKKIPPLPFELALLPKKFYRWLNLSVVSYAIPALIAVGIVIFKKKKSENSSRWIRKKSENKALKILQDSMPASGGFLEAIPLTAFVALSLINAGYARSKVVKKGIEFLKKSQRIDGGFPIDIDLSTWVTTLSIKALGENLHTVINPNQQLKLLSHLKSIQNKRTHPFNGTPPGGWGWTNYSGSVPDCDDTPGAILALLKLAQPQKVANEVMAGGAWLLKLQNKDGGFPTFSRGWGKLPFDKSCADLTGHCFLAIASVLHFFGNDLSENQKINFEKSLQKSFVYLQKNQAPDGAWLPLWFGNQETENHENPVYGTAKVTIYLYDALPMLNKKLKQQVQSMISQAQKYLVAAQNSDGSWGGKKETKGSIEETSYAISALGQKEFNKNKIAGFDWLENYHKSNGLQAAPIGLYFASLWYDEKMYPLTSYLEAVNRNKSLISRG